LGIVICNQSQLDSTQTGYEVGIRLKAAVGVINDADLVDVDGQLEIGS